MRRCRSARSWSGTWTSKGRMARLVMVMLPFLCPGTKPAVSGLALPSAQCVERRAQLFGKQLRLFPGGEVAAFFGFVEVDKVVVGLLGPAARRVDVLLRKHRDCRREGNVGGGVEVLAGDGLLPVQPRRGRGGVGEPVERGVVEPVVARDGAVGMSGKEPTEVLVAARVVIKKPGREADGRVRQAVADRLRTGALDDAVPAVIGRERDLFIRALFRVREVSRRAIAVADVAEHVEGNHLREVDVDA